MDRAHLLDKISSIWARPITLERNQAKGNEARLLDKILGLGPESLLNYPVRSQPPYAAPPPRLTRRNRQ